MSKKYWYEMLKRPVGIGCQPKGFIEVISDKGRWGIVAYNRQLSQSELDDYEMAEYNEVLHYDDLTLDEKTDALLSSTLYLLDNYTEFFTEKDLKFLKSAVNLNMVCHRLAKGERNIDVISNTLEEQIVDEAIQYGIEHGYGM